MPTLEVLAFLGSDGHLPLVLGFGRFQSTLYVPGYMPLLFIGIRGNERGETDDTISFLKIERHAFLVTFCLLKREARILVISLKSAQSIASFPVCQPRQVAS